MTAPNADPMTRIAAALETLVLCEYDDGPGRHDAFHRFRERIEARHSVPTVAVPVLPPTDASVPPPDDDPEWGDVPAEMHAQRALRPGDRWFSIFTRAWHVHRFDPDVRLGSRSVWIKRHDHPGRKSGTVDVLGSELRAGDYIVDVRASEGWWEYVGARVTGVDGTGADLSNGCWLQRATSEHLCRVRLPRPAVEPSAPLAFRSGQRVRLSSWADTDGVVVDYLTPLGFVDSHGTPWAASLGTWLRVPDAEPSASGEGIVRASGEDAAGIARRDGGDSTNSVIVGAHRITLGSPEAAQRAEMIVNYKHRIATRELRARCERVERDRDEVRASLFSCATLRDEYERERSAAIARAEAAERVVEAMRDEHGRSVLFSARTLSALSDYYAARKDGAR